MSLFFPSILLFLGEPVCAPPNETMAQGYIDLLRALHGSTKAWQNSIESYVQQKIRQIDSVSEYEKLHEIQDVTKVKTLVNQLSQEVQIFLENFYFNVSLYSQDYVYELYLQVWPLVALILGTFCTKFS